jgi:hypothetical protein
MLTKSLAAMVLGLLFLQLPDPSVTARIIDDHRIEVKVTAASRPLRVSYYGRATVKFVSEQGTVLGTKVVRVSRGRALKNGSTRTDTLVIPAVARGATDVQVADLIFCGGSVQMLASGNELPCD